MVALSRDEIDLLCDALAKGESRHWSYARFYPGRRQEQHEKAAVGMAKLADRLKRYIRV